tara:strand:- start:2699 stop:2890 length:192 start_codon:yes stop_codon:yes gene_type:complete
MMENLESPPPPKISKISKDFLYRTRHPDRVKASYLKHYAENKHKINERRREKRRLLKVEQTLV